MQQRRDESGPRGCALQDSQRTLQVTLAALESLRSGRSVCITDTTEGTR